MTFDRNEENMQFFRFWNFQGILRISQEVREVQDMLNFTMQDNMIREVDSYHNCTQI